MHSAFGININLFEDTPRRDLTFIELADYDGFTAEQHYVTTEDGYILGLFRIPLNEKCTTSKGTILFMHGLYLSSDDCLVPGPGKAHCYIYSDQCYDVWAANVRGNFYGRNHTTLNPDKDSAFWDFDIDEMATRDLPAIIDYVLMISNETQLTFVGHSQAVTILLILCSKKPEYNANIKVGFGISPTAWLGNSKLIVVQFQGLLSKTVPDSVLSREIFKRGGIIQEPVKFICSLKELSYPLCSGAYFALFGYDNFQITKSVLPVVVGHTLSGTSVKNFLRWGQIHNIGFREYDHGTIKNLIIYGSRTPPEYDLSKVTMPWLFAGSHNDYVANVTDIQLLVTKLPNSSLCVLSDTTFGHLDFIYGKDIPNYVTPILLSYLDTGKNVCP
ncbi:lipase 3-like [Trichoplusia ni]|uniref:Lipase n=1 Tax=Trichoplusia ni TaxID=7111 RepID=A0A7E5WE48_TRINI|nr:lipase 3-like [Trichoplusia ni]